MSKKYLTSTWKDPKDLPGVGEYAAAAWQMFVEGRLPVECPRDGALSRYYKWRKNGS
jgi:hypothetical protein